MSTQNQQSLRIFTIISQIEQTLESAPRPKLGGGSRRIVDVDEIYDLLGDLKVTIPEDIRRANSVLIEADTLLEHANQEAVDVVDQAQQEADALHRQSLSEAEQIRRAAEEEFEARVAEDKVLLEVQRRAELLQKQAENNANIVYNGAKQYADEILQDVQRYLMGYHHMVGQNRTELGVVATRPPVQQQAAQPVQQAAPQHAKQDAPQSVKRPVEPQAPVAQAEAKEEEEDFQPRRKRGWFRRKDEDELFEEEDPLEKLDEEETPKSRRRAKRAQDDDLDMDLEE